MTNNEGKLGLFSCVAIIVGACIGSAIFSISGMTICIAGGSAILSWVIAALVYCAYGTIVAELAIRFPHSGGIFIFPKRAFAGKSGNFWGFVSSWGYITSNIIAIGFSAIYAGIYFEAGFPEFCSAISLPFTTASQSISLYAIILDLAIILSGGERSQTIQNLLVIVLIGSMALYCIYALFSDAFTPANFRAFFTSGEGGAGGFLSSVPLAMVAYGGCVAIAFMTSEVRRPERNVPRSLFVGLAIVALIYATIIASVIGTLPVSTLRDDASIRFIPLFASISEGSLSQHQFLAKVVSFSGTLALVTTITVLMRVNARAVQAISQQGFLPDSFSKENKQSVLLIPMLLMALVGAVMCFFADMTQIMITLGAVLNIASMTITCTALIIARKKKRGEHSDFKAPLGAFLPAAVITVFWICYIPDVIQGGGRMWLFTAAVYLLGMIVYLSRRPTALRRMTGLIIHGKGHGRLHKMPSANLQPYEKKSLPQYGVWAVKVFVQGGIYKGLTNVGLRPTDDDSQVPTVETFILDFRGEIYDSELTVEFLHYIRPTRKFDNLDQLKAQIDKDILSI